MRATKQGSGRAARVAAFSFVELLVAIVIAAGALTAAAIGFGTLANTRRAPSGSTMDVTLPGGVLNNFYGMANATITVEPAPNYGELSRAEGMREVLERDIGSATAVFALARNIRSGFRPTAINIPASTNTWFLTSPTDFRNLLDPGATTFVPFTGAATNATNASIFIISAGNSTSTANVRSIYEVDIVPAVNPQGYYASVRRYAGGTLTSYYHVFYPQTNTANFRPLVAYFERNTLGTGGADVTNAFRRAVNRPFYFLWWPDPAQPSLPATPPGAYSNAARNLYTNLATSTSFFLVVPAFPAL